MTFQLNKNQIEVKSILTFSPLPSPRPSTTCAWLSLSAGLSIPLATSSALSRTASCIIPSVLWTSSTTLLISSTRSVSFSLSGRARWRTPRPRVSSSPSPRKAQWRVSTALLCWDIRLVDWPRFYVMIFCRFSCFLIHDFVFEWISLYSFDHKSEWFQFTIPKVRLIQIKIWMEDVSSSQIDNLIDCDYKINSFNL